MGHVSIEGWFPEDSLAGLGPESRPGAWTGAQCEDALRRWTDTGPGKIGSRGGKCLKALLLLWNDHLDASHGLVQDMAGPDAAFVHGIMHRREPDPGNARYWFHRVGEHPAFVPLAQCVRSMEMGGGSGIGALIPGGRWDPMAFIDRVSRLQGGGRGEGGLGDEGELRRVQRWEFLVLARHLAGT